MMFPKFKRVKLYGDEKKELREAIFKRSKYRCVICGRPAKEWHHEPPGANKSDELEKGVALCHECHEYRTNHDWDGSMKRKIREYLNGLYGTFDKLKMQGLIND